MGWIVFPKKICWSPNRQLLRIWPYTQNRVFADVTKYEGRPNPVWLVSLQEREGHLKTETEMRGMLPEAGRHQEGSAPRDFRETIALTTPWFGTSEEYISTQGEKKRLFWATQFMVLCYCSPGDEYTAHSIFSKFRVRTYSLIPS